MRKKIKEKLTFVWATVLCIAVWLVLFPEERVQSWLFWECYLVLMLLAVVYTAQNLLKNPYDVTEPLVTEPIMNNYQEPVRYQVVVDLSAWKGGDVANTNRVLRHYGGLSFPEATRFIRDNMKRRLNEAELTVKDVDDLVASGPVVPKDVQVRFRSTKEGVVPLTLGEWKSIVRGVKPNEVPSYREHSIPQPKENS